MPPRNVKKKQTRLSFASSAATPSHEASLDKTSRYATLRYNNDRVRTASSKKPVQGIHQALPKKQQPQNSKTRQSSTTRQSSSTPSTKDVIPTQDAILTRNVIPTQDISIDKPANESFLLADHQKRTLRGSRVISTQDISIRDSPDESSLANPQKQTLRGSHVVPTQDISIDKPSNESSLVANPNPQKQTLHGSSAHPEARSSVPQDDNTPPKPLKMPRAKKSQRVLRFSLKGAASIDSEELAQSRRATKRKATSPITVSDDDDPVIASSKKRSKVSELARTSASPNSDEDNEIVAPSTARKRRARKAIHTNESDDSDEPVASSPMKRLRRGPDMEHAQLPHTPRRASKQARLDIEEDLEDLQDSVVKKTRTRGRNVVSARDKRLKQLEVLRRRRAGLKEESEDEGDETFNSDVEEMTNPTNISPSGQGLWKHHEENSDVESTIDPNEDLDRYEDDFVLEDGKDDLGVPTEEIPFEFTRHAYKKPKEYFRDVIGWMVQNKLNPAFPRSDAMYEMAFMKLEDEVKGRAGSQLISSVWTPGFVYALQARPHMDVSAYPTEDNHSCDACRRSGHPASADMRLFGKAYSLATLEPLNDDDDDSDSNDDSNKSSNDGIDRDRIGHVLPDERAHFYLGKQCKSRAVLAHTLTHWRYHLNEWVIDHLERMGHMEDEEILRRNNLSIKRKTRNANDVLDKMVNTGEVEKLWRDFHLNLKSAREKESIYG